MNSKQILEWVKKPGLSGREEGAQLDALLQSYPYFQTAQLCTLRTYTIREVFSIIII